ncbi:MAG: recombinase family protein [Coprobacillus sp.]|nr:recombinase family protein [Coprobacillus sp.]
MINQKTKKTIINTSKRKRVGIYARVSTNEQAKEGYSIDAQIRKGKSYVELFEMEVESIKIYLDEGKSAGSLKRKSLQELLKAVEGGEIDTIIINKLDRLSRDVINIYYLIEFFIEHNCDLISIGDNLDIKSATGRVVVGILAVLAQFERDQDKERTEVATIEMLDQGLYPFAGSPYGYSKDKEKKLSINESEAKIIVRIVNHLIEGIPLAKIVDDINDEYQLSLKYENIRRYLLKDTICGEIIFRDVLYDNVIPKLVDKNKLQIARETMRKRKKVNTSDKYYFKNKVRCTCGSLCVQESTHKRNKKYYYYKCQNCGQRINQDKLLAQALVDIIYSSNKSNIEKNKRKVIEHVRRINKKIENTNNYFNNEIIDVISFTGIMYKLEKEREELLQELKIYENKKIDWNKLNDKQRGLFIQDYVVNVIVHTPLKMVVSIEMKTKVR